MRITAACTGSNPCRPQKGGASSASARALQTGVVHTQTTKLAKAANVVAKTKQLQGAAGAVSWEYIPGGERPWND